MRKDLDIEFEGFTYSDRTLNIEVAYDFRRHGYAERNYISDPDEWSNLFHWKGPPDRWRVHFPTEPDDDETRSAAPGGAAGAAAGVSCRTASDFDICRQQSLHGASARGEEVPRRPRASSPATPRM